MADVHGVGEHGPPWRRQLARAQARPVEAAEKGVRLGLGGAAARAAQAPRRVLDEQLQDEALQLRARARGGGGGGSRRESGRCVRARAGGKGGAARSAQRRTSLSVTWLGNSTTPRVMFLQMTSWSLATRSAKGE